jgi:hypothetical protein
MLHSGGMDSIQDPHVTLRSLVDLAVASDDPARLVATAAVALGRPVGLVDAGGKSLAYAPDDPEGRRALAVARAAARSVVAPPGWHVFSLVQHSSRLGYLAVGANGPTEATSLIDLVPRLIADQLRRAALVRLHAGAFVRRLVSDPPLAPHHARREAAELGLSLAEAYRPAILTWRGGTARAEVLEGVERDARALAEGTLSALLGSHLVLLHPATGGRPDRSTEWFEAVVALTRARAPSSRARAIAAERAVGLGDLSAQVAALEEFCRFGPRSQDDRLVTSAREYALDDLLHGRIEPETARRFVDAHVGGLIEWDRQHGTDLAGVLEAALDFPRHDQAARKCFMHRNTFRHRLTQATELLGDRLENPDVRLAVHVALKLRRLIAAETACEGLGRQPRSRPRTRWVARTRVKA